MNEKDLNNIIGFLLTIPVFFLFIGLLFNLQMEINETILIFSIFSGMIGLLILSENQ